MTCLRLFLVFGLLVAIHGGGAAAELKLGGYAVEPPADAGAPASAPETVAPVEPDMTLNFTPRMSGTLYNARPDGGSNEGLRLAMGLDEHWTSVERMGALGFDYDRTDKDEMMLGGALVLDRLAITTGLGRTKLFGTSADLVGAGFSYGPLSARVLLGEGGPEASVERDIMMFSTDLNPYPWLSFQGDVALSEDDDEESQAVGRLGVQLRF